MALVFPYIWIPNGGVVPIEIYTWGNGTDEQIKAMIDAADAGLINLLDYWTLGNSRKVHISEIAASDAFPEGLSESDVYLTLADTGENSGYVDITGKPVNFVCSMNRMGSTRMNTSGTNIGSWNDCAMRADLNDIFYNALPVTFRSCLKKFNVITAEAYNSTTNQISQDYISIFAEKEILGSKLYSTDSESEVLKEVVRVSNINVTVIPGYPVNIWTRSPSVNSDREFCSINYNTKTTYAYNGTKSGKSSVATYNTYNIIPFMCI